MTQREVVDALRDCDHAFLTPEAVKKFTNAFGFDGSTYLAKANPQDFKGLTLKNGVKEARGQDADEVACQIADRLFHNCTEPQVYNQIFGRGSRLRAACDAIEEHLKKVVVS